MTTPSDGNPVRKRALRAFLLRHKALTVTAAVVLLALFVAGAALFQPWRLFTSSTIDEALPGVGQTATPTGTLAVEPVPADPGTGAPTLVPAPAVVIAKGAFLSQEHPTSGTASLVKLPDGGLVLRLENLASSDGPDVKVWLSNQEAGGDWFKYRSGKWLDLGPVKATHGNQNYPVPAGADISGLTTVVLWCDRFSVAFGSAALE
ncbi:DM13 domain-containing protein [Arthrobacter celericrescens]|uniref:DM13 domain-containing protein n=1 Tax=Arthrobacter celericrescens TaxID=2320851 RepID=UPI000EA31F8B|nr:DM13 domain-containing protein [Arthrobacter celericrescens]